MKSGAQKIQTDFFMLSFLPAPCQRQYNRQTGTNLKLYKLKGRLCMLELIYILYEYITVEASFIVRLRAIRHI